MEKILDSNPLIGPLLDLSLKKRGESMQLGCQKKLQEELKNIWASAVLSGNHLFDQPSFKSRALVCLKSPFSQNSPTIEVLIYLIKKQMGIFAPPFVPRYQCLPLFELCQLTVLWSIAGFYKEASSLAHSISSFLDYPYLWCKEEEYDEFEINLSIAFFRNQVLPNPKPTHSFFLALEKLFFGFDVPCSVDFISPVPLFFHSSYSQGIATLLGRQTSLGSFFSEDIEIRCFGPQGLPLNDPEKFGIERAINGKDHWTQVSALPQVWLKVIDFFESGLEVHFLGLIPETPLRFSFYVKAPMAQVGELKLFPKNLNRYQGVSKPIVLGGKLQIESLLPTQMEVIPLAGEGAFWGAQFLLSFEIYSLESRCLFQWNLIE